VAYRVDQICDEAGRLQAVLDLISQQEGRVISVMWRPGCATHFGDTVLTPASYVIVSESGGKPRADKRERAAPELAWSSHT
jgi:hypothetical protein